MRWVARKSASCCFVLVFHCLPLSEDGELALWLDAFQKRGELQYLGHELRRRAVRGRLTSQLTQTSVG